MKFRRRTHRLAKPAVRWFSSNLGYTNTGFLVNVAARTFVVLAEHQRQNTAASDVEFGERHTINAIRGDIVTAGPAEDPANLQMGIIVRRIDAGGTPEDLSPAVVADASLQWLWLHHCIVPANPGTQDFYRVDVHIKTKRVLKENEQLVLVLQNDGGGANVQVWPYLRTLISRAV